MSYDETLALRIRDLLADRTDVVEKKMFGGLCFMVNGCMCCGLTKTDLMVRVGPEQYDDALSRPYARPMDFTGRPLAGMVYVAPEGLRTRAALASWINRGITFVSTVPAKTRSGQRRAESSAGPARTLPRRRRG
jgi:TfoX/Sxy family transcriptional regulator of competence genes